MNDIIIRKANKDYVCDCCGHIIRAGSEYLDEIITHDSKAVRHERYHDECPYADDNKQDKFIHKLLDSKDMIAECTVDHCKYHVIGLTVSTSGIYVELLDWQWLKVPDVPIKTFVEVYKYE